MPVHRGEARADSVGVRAAVYEEEGERQRESRMIRATALWSLPLAGLWVCTPSNTRITSPAHHNPRHHQPPPFHRNPATTTATPTTTAPSDLLLYSHISPIGSAFHQHPDLLHRYMNYTPTLSALRPTPRRIPPPPRLPPTPSRAAFFSPSPPPPSSAPTTSRPSPPPITTQRLGIKMRKWGKWVAEIREPNKRSRIWRRLGSHSTPKAAARAYDTAVFYLRGPTARLNFPEFHKEEGDGGNQAKKIISPNQYVVNVIAIPQRQKEAICKAKH
ncbi:hypothetical protein Syun_002229 [Stephania yunnanensis]|uniref:AP2/ERF domain-containing protein n=1 Tax=Stephania yunnanensis TaxID=152371 RepID=A0AAP0LL28_9MAGN